VVRLPKQGREIPHRGPRSHPDVGIALPTFLPFSSTRLPYIGFGCAPLHGFFVAHFWKTQRLLFVGCLSTWRKHGT
jgi:hypothetical protein